MAGSSSVVTASTMVDFPEPMSPVSRVFLAFASSDQTRWSNVPQLYSSRRVSRKPLRVSVMLLAPLSAASSAAYSASLASKSASHWASTKALRIRRTS